MEDKKQFKCSGDCLKCTPIQRQYCSSQFTYNTMRMVEDIQHVLSDIRNSVDEMKEKIDAIQGNEATIFDPLKTEQDTAQEWGGAPIDPKNNYHHKN